MHYVVPPYLSRIFNVLLTGGLVFLLSCQSDPILYDINNGYNYHFHSFQVDPDSVISIQSEHSNEESPRLYAGIINSSDTVYSVIRLLFDKSHKICEATSIDSVSIKVYTTTQLDSLQKDDINKSLHIHSSISGSLWDEWEQNKVINSLDYKIDEDAFIIDFTNDSLLVDRWCKIDSSYDILIKYLPDTDSLIEFFSSNYLDNPYKLPYLYLHYQGIGDTTFSIIDSFQIQINETESVYNEFSSVTDSSHMIYAFNIKEGTPTFPLSDSLITTLDDIILEIGDIDLMQIDFNLTEDIVDSLETLSFSLVSGIAYINDSDTTVLQKNIFLNNDLCTIYTENNSVCEASLPSPNDSTISIWISEVTYKQESSSGKIDIKANTSMPIKGIQFQLKHTPYKQQKTQDVTKYDYNFSFEDITISPVESYNENLANNLFINYSNNLSAQLSFTGLQDSLNTKQELIISPSLSNMILHIDTVNSKIIDYMKIMITTPEIVDSNVFYLMPEDYIVKIPIGDLIKKYGFSKEVDFTNFQLKTDYNTHNYSLVKFFYNSSDDTLNPRLDLIYTK